MKIAVTITTCGQIGIDTWKDFHTTKIFHEDATLKAINDWIKSIDKTSDFSSAKFSVVVD